MNNINATEASKNLFRLIDETTKSHAPIFILGSEKNAVLVAEEDWNAIQETLYLISIPTLRDSIREGLATPLEDCDRDVHW